MFLSPEIIKIKMNKQTIERCTLYTIHMHSHTICSHARSTYIKSRRNPKGESGRDGTRLYFLTSARIEIALFDMARFSGSFVENRESICCCVGRGVHLETEKSAKNIKKERGRDGSSR